MQFLILTSRFILISGDLPIGPLSLLPTRNAHLTKCFWFHTLKTLSSSVISYNIFVVLHDKARLYSLINVNV